MFEELIGTPISGSRKPEDKVLLMDLLRAELFYPTRTYIRKSHDFSCMIAKEIAAVILVELRDPGKVTSGVLESVKGRYCQTNVTEEDRQLCMGMKAHNTISESCHANLTAALRLGGTMRLDYAGAAGQTIMNGDFKRGHETLVTGKRSKAERDAEHEGTPYETPVMKKGSFTICCQRLGMGW